MIFHKNGRVGTGLNFFFLFTLVRFGDGSLSDENDGFDSDSHTLYDAQHIYSYQADTFFLKQHSKSKVKFVVLINVETRKGYAYHVPDLKKKSILEIFNQWIILVEKSFKFLSF